MIFRYNIRNTSNIYQCTVNRTALGSDTLANQVEGVEPDIRLFTRKQQLLSSADSIVNKLVNKEGVLPEKITVLCNRAREKSVFANVDYLSNYRIVDLNQKAPGSIAFSTVEDFKGLESDIIISSPRQRLWITLSRIVGTRSYSGTNAIGSRCARTAMTERPALGFNRNWRCKLSIIVLILE